VLGAFWLFLKFGKFGIWIRATTQDRVMAQAMGIPVPWVHTATFAIGASILAAIFISLLEAYASIWVSPRKPSSCPSSP
jgi:branched-subunit amino acid ABC-type transport system permease component